MNLLVGDTFSLVWFTKSNSQTYGALYFGIVFRCPGLDCESICVLHTVEDCGQSTRPIIWCVGTWLGFNSRINLTS